MNVLLQTNLLRIFRTPFRKSNSGLLLLDHLPLHFNGFYLHETEFNISLPKTLCKNKTKPYQI